MGNLGRPSAQIEQQSRRPITASSAASRALSVRGSFFRGVVHYDWGQSYNGWWIHRLAPGWRKKESNSNNSNDDKSKKNQRKQREANARGPVDQRRFLSNS